MIRKDKTPRQASLLDIAIQATELAQDLKLAIERGRKIIQLDEFVVTKHTWPTHAWTRQKENIPVDQSQAYNKVLAVVLAVSRERGIELVDIYERSINKPKFKLFLERLRALNFWSDVTLVMDNLSVHKSNEVRERMTELDFEWSFTPAYSPRYNGIEEVIGIGKHQVKQMRLEKVQ